MKRAEILTEAYKCVTTDREQQYGSPEDNFNLIANFWNTYLDGCFIDAHDVAIMMALLKVARIRSGQIKEDNYVDLIGYAACAGELITKVTTDDRVKQVAEENAGCEYCDDKTFHDRANIISDGNIEAIIDTDNTLYVAYTENEYHYKDSCIKINYCPMCGRKLPKEATDDR